MRAFNEISYYDFSNGRHGEIVREIQSKGKDYILKIDEQEFIEYLYQKYLLEPLQIIDDSESFDTPRISKERINNDMYGRSSNYEVDAYAFTIRYNYTGSTELFRVQSNPWTMTSYDIHVDSSAQTVSFSFKIYRQDAEEFKRTKSQCYGNAFANLGKMNVNIVDFNRNLKDTITRAFQREKEKYLSENNFFAAINVKVNPDTKSVFTTPTIAKKVIPQPSVSPNKEFSSEPMMSAEMYKDVLRVIYDSGKNMEKKPALYVGKDGSVSNVLVYCYRIYKYLFFN